MKNAPNVIEFPAAEGYPADYLLARLGSRRSFMLREWESLLAAGKPALPERYAKRGGRPDEAVMRGLKAELRWVARQMDGGLRKIFRPVFIYFELGTLFSCLRYKAAKGAGERVESALAWSMVASDLKVALKEADTQAEAIGVIEETFSRRSSAYGGLVDTFTKAGMSEAEQKLTDTFLTDAAKSSGHPVIRGFFRAVIDMRNVISAYKRMRWGIENAPLLLEGGDIKLARLKELTNEAALLAAMKRLTGLSASRPTEVEGLFLKRLLSYSKKASRGPQAVGFVLNYLLNCHREAKNLSLIIAGGIVDRELLRGELVV